MGPARRPVTPVLAWKSSRRGSAFAYPRTHLYLSGDPTSSWAHPKSPRSASSATRRLLMGMTGSPTKTVTAATAKAMMISESQNPTLSFKGYSISTSSATVRKVKKICVVGLFYPAFGCRFQA
jgi:hypothetical protein